MEIKLDEVFDKLVTDAERCRDEEKCYWNGYVQGVKDARNKLTLLASGGKAESGE